MVSKAYQILSTSDSRKACNLNRIRSSNNDLVCFNIYLVVFIMSFIYFYSIMNLAKCGTASVTELGLAIVDVAEFAIPREL